MARKAVAGQLSVEVRTEARALADKIIQQFAGWMHQRIKSDPPRGEAWSDIFEPQTGALSWMAWTMGTREGAYHEKALRALWEKVERGRDGRGNPVTDSPSLL